ncbi:MAG: asparagine synthase (glutamine-hydrolyzing), partial [Gemmatimonadaceae bacterium]|nr:asparagine synthase (glutamine-hydrolyzing) [Gemmatimonadaceae bacterium]
MCGIVGTFASSSSTPSDLQAIAGGMADTIPHRGPDDAGTWVDPTCRVSFGFRRLAILDLSAAGHQPMASPGGRFTIAFNGEIYNHLQLREELGAAERWRGHSDTETLLRGFERWGIEATVRRTTGMFAIAVWDHERAELTLVRDRLGKKPLYLHRAPGRLSWASEMRAFRAVPGFRPEVDPAALAAYLRYLYVPAPWSILRGVRKLMPGTMLTLRAPDDEGVTTTYWSPLAAAAAGREGPFRGAETEAEDAADAVLREAVSSRLLSDVPVGAFLSGGIDSSLVVAMMAETARETVRTYAVSFPERDFDEGAHAAAIAAHLGTRHTTFPLAASDLEGVVPTLAEHFDEPNADPSCVPTYLISKLARRDVTVALTGDGGDEAFGGYNRYSRGAPLLRAASLVPVAARRQLVALGEGALSRRLSQILGGGGRQQSGASRDRRTRRVLAEPSVRAMYEQMVTTTGTVAGLVRGAESPALDGLAALDDPRFAIAERMMLFDQGTYLPDDLLAKVDRASMAVSLEARAPLLDHRVLEFAWRLPLRMKLRGGKGKWMLRRLLA